jgi:RNA polymerase primary sigma factor
VNVVETSTMPGDLMDFIDNNEYRTKRWQKTLAELGLPPIPAALLPIDGWEPYAKSNGPTFVMSRDVERNRFLQLNWYKREHNRLLKESQHKRVWKALTAAENAVTHMREYLTRVNLPLVYSTVARTRGRFSRIDWNEAVSEGQIGLMRAINGYDTSFGVKFSTYSVRIVLNCLMSAAQKRQKQTARLATVEIPEQFSGDDGTTVAEDHELGFALETLKAVMNGNLARLTHVEQTVIRMRFGPEKVTLETVGEQIGVSKERIRQIQNAALAKLRAALTERDV